MSKGGVGGDQQTPFGGQSQMEYQPQQLPNQRDWRQPQQFQRDWRQPPQQFQRDWRQPQQFQGGWGQSVERDPPVWGPPPFRPPMRGPGNGGPDPWSSATNPIFMPGSSYRQPWIPSGYGQMQYSPQRFSGYGALPDMSYRPPFRPPMSYPGKGGGTPPSGPIHTMSYPGKGGGTPPTFPKQQQQAEGQAEGQVGQTGQPEQIAQTGQMVTPELERARMAFAKGSQRWTPAQRRNFFSGARGGRGYFNQVRPSDENQFGNYSLGNYGQTNQLRANGGIVGISRGRVH